MDIYDWFQYTYIQDPVIYNYIRRPAALKTILLNYVAFVLGLYAALCLYRITWRMCQIGALIIRISLTHMIILRYSIENWILRKYIDYLTKQGRQLRT